MNNEIESRLIVSKETRLGSLKSSIIADILRINPEINVTALNFPSTTRDQYVVVLHVLINKITELQYELEHTRKIQDE